MYNTFSGVSGYKIWELNDYDYGYPKRHLQQPQQSNKKPKHKYQVNDMVLDVVEGKVGCIRELLSWPDYLVDSVDSSIGSWICNETHIEPLTKDSVKDIVKESSSSIDDYWKEEQEPALCPLYNPLYTKIIDITDTGDITISKDKVDLANDGGICVTDTINKHDKDIEELTHISDINMQKTTNIEVKTCDIERKMKDIEKKQKRISKLSKLALLSRFL